MVLSQWTKGSSTILNQQDAGLIIVGAMKSMIVSSLPLRRVYGPIRSTHNTLHGIVITGLARRCPYLSLCFVLTRHDLHAFVIDQIEIRMPFLYIATFIVSSR
jgi:hypothetical protein